MRAQTPPLAIKTERVHLCKNQPSNPTKPKAREAVILVRPIWVLLEFYLAYEVFEIFEVYEFFKFYEVYKVYEVY